MFEEQNNLNIEPENPLDVTQNITDKPAMDRAQGFFEVFHHFRPLCNSFYPNTTLVLPE
jgi:hypothetical protein